MFGKYSCVQISSIMGLTLNQVYDVRRRLNLTDKQNPIFEINDLQNQILLSGKLGDGNFKKNGKNHYYRESHAEDEKEYLEWKMNKLGEHIITKNGLYKIKKGGWNVQQMYGFMTRTSPVFTDYKNLNVTETIRRLDHRGLIMYLLDDGWYSGNYKNWHFFISGGTLTLDDLKTLCVQFDKYNIRDVHIVGNKRYDISIPKENNNYLYEMATEFMPNDIDIIKKKFEQINL